MTILPSFEFLDQLAWSLYLRFDPTERMILMFEFWVTIKFRVNLSELIFIEITPAAWIFIKRLSFNKPRAKDTLFFRISAIILLLVVVFLFKWLSFILVLSLEYRLLVFLLCGCSAIIVSSVSLIVSAFLSFHIFLRILLSLSLGTPVLLLFLVVCWGSFRLIV